MKEVRYMPRALKDLRRHANVAAKINRTIAEYARGGGAHANQVRALVGTPVLRMRIGYFRAIFEETADVITVQEIGPRGSIYE